MKQLIILTLLIAATSCGGNAGKKTQAANTAGEDQTPRTATEYAKVDFTRDEDFLKEWKALKKRFSFIEYVTKTEAGNLYLFSNKAYSLPDRYNHPDSPYLKIGMLDGNGNQLLACSYEKIGNPGGIVSGWVEIFQDGKYGLYNYTDKQMVEPQFDVIFPSPVMGYIAIGGKGDQFYKIHEDGKLVLITNESEQPSYQKLGKFRNFDIQNNHISWWINIPELTEASDETEEPGTGLIFPPSYLANLKVVPEFIERLITENSYEGGIEKLSVTSDKTVQRNKKVNTFLEAFYEEGSDGRGYETETKHLVTVRNKAKVVDSKKIFNPYRFQGDVLKDNFQAVTFLNDSLVEVKEILYSYEEESMYQCMTVFSYFAIDNNGKIKALYPKSYFEMASAVKLTPEHFKGLFFIPTPDFDYDVEQPEGNILVTRHLNLKDLQYMRNEVYARHGYIFKDAYWNETFGKTKWYKGKSTNVDAKITPLEKQNLQFIQEWEKKLKTDEQKYTKPEKKTYFEAG